jgi:uncharacterized damage-inducible protein DinB
MEPEMRVVNNCLVLLEQAPGVLRRIDDDVYASTCEISPRASIGGHLRHTLDFFQCFIKGIDQGRIDYNLRERDALTEIDRRYAVARIQALSADLRSLSLRPASTRLKVRTEDDGVDLAVWCDSSVLRELEFLQSHTVHHYSLIATLLRLHGIEPDAEFGVAPSTLKYWKEEAACAR